MAQCTMRWFLSLQITLYLFLIFVQGNEDAEDAYKSGKSLVLENFLPIDFASVVKEPPRREKRDVEGSGENESYFSELKENDDVENSTENAHGKLVILEEKQIKNLTAIEEGSGEVAEEISDEQSSAATIIDDSEILTIPEKAVTEGGTEEVLTSTEMIFDKPEDFDVVEAEVRTTVDSETITVKNRIESEITTENLMTTTPTNKPPVMTEEISTVWTTESITLPVEFDQKMEGVTRNLFSTHKTTIVSQEVPEDSQTVIHKTTTPHFVEETTAVPVAVFRDVPTQTVIDKITSLQAVEETTPTVVPIVPQEVPVQSETIKITTPRWVTTAKLIEPKVNPSATEGLRTLEELLTTPEPIVEEVFKETRMDEKLEAAPGNILQKENLSLGADPQLITNTRLVDSEETVQLSSAEPKRLGAYIVIGLILLSFSTLVGYITFRKRMNRKRQEFESNQESNDTEKALLSLTDYKDNSELEESHLKNNEITPIVVKSNTQINKFEKNTNFSSPKNLNTIANEKNIEKDNVLKSTAENLTQVIIEDSPKELEENVPDMEKLIVKTRIDQDSIPKKPIIINRSSTGYIPIPQDNS